MTHSFFFSKRKREGTKKKRKKNHGQMSFIVIDKINRFLLANKI